MCLLPRNHYTKKKKKAGGVVTVIIFCNDVAITEGRAIQEHVAM